MVRPLPSNMVHSFSQVPKAEIPRSSFDRSNNLKTTFNAGYLVPIFWDEVLPGDTFNLRMTGFARLATPIFPFMDNVFMNTFYFFVPSRLLWANFQKFMGEQDNPGDSTDYLVPTVTCPSGGYASNSIFDYLEMPTLVPGLSPIAMLLRAYNRIWNEWFRDQNLQDSVPMHVDDGPDPYADYQLLRRGKRHDYFSSSLPWPQKGSSVDIPLGTSAPVRGIGTTNQAGFGGGPTTFYETGGTSRVYQHYASVDTLATLGVEGTSASSPNSVNIYTDLSSATGATINQLRQAFQMQKLLERDARGGTRYTEIVRAHFNVVSPDARLQRPEYLGGGQSQLNLFQVPQTSATASEPSPQGNLAAYGTVGLNQHGFTKSFTEHGYILGLVSVRADIGYQQGLNRALSRSTKYDFYWPALSSIGEQAVLMQEIYATGTSADDTVWGYQERYAEYRYKPSMVTGEFRSNFPQSLDTWHLALDFGTAPSLSDSFIQDDPPIARVVAVDDGPQFILDSFNRLQCARAMPMYGVPGNIDRF